MEEVQTVNSGADWVLGNRLAELVGTTPRALHRKRQRGTLLEGEHYVMRGNRIYYSISAYNRWVQAGTSAATMAQP